MSLCPCAMHVAMYDYCYTVTNIRRRIIVTLSSQGTMDAAEDGHDAAAVAAAANSPQRAGSQADSPEAKTPENLPSFGVATREKHSGIQGSGFPRNGFVYFLR